VEKPDDFAFEVLKGRRISDLRDRAGKSMTDTYLSRKLGEQYAWVPGLYERASGYVHFSSTHMLSALRPKGEGATAGHFEVAISAEDKFAPEATYIEAVDAFVAVTEIVLRYVQGWVFTKSHPEVTGRSEQEHGTEDERRRGQ
jgi:hypothetical protein